MKSKWPNTAVVWVGALICCALWGSAFPCIKLGYEWTKIEASDTAAQILYAGMRFTLAGVIAVMIASVLAKKVIVPKVNALGKIAVLSLFQTVLQYLFFYVGLANCSGVKASIVEGMNVFVVIIISGLIFRIEKVTPQKALGCIIGFLGVIFVNLSNTGLDFSFSLRGEGFILISTISYGISSVLLKQYSKTENPIMLSGYQFMAGGIFMIIAGLLCGGRVTMIAPRAIGMLLWLAVVSSVAYSLWGVLLKYNEPSKVAVFGFMNPVFGVLLSAWLLSESEMLGVRCIVALLFVCTGIFLVNKKESTPILK